MPIVFTAIRGRPPALPRGREGVLVVVAAIFGVFGYCAAVWAMSLAPMGQVSALRETSILFAALIGAVALREPMTGRKIIGGIAVTIGIGLLALD
jgi:drug/metabolite transporter (DMT)-like permease